MSRPSESATTKSKKDLRKHMKQTLAPVTEEEVAEQSVQVKASLSDMLAYQSCKSISIFMSMPKVEVQTEAIMQAALEAGKQVFIPYIYKTASSSGTEGSSTMDMLQLRDMDDYKSLKPDKWGIPSIDAKNVNERTNAFGTLGLTNGLPMTLKGSGLDVILMPGMAFDTERNRLGHGKGYYDNFLSRYHLSLPEHNEHSRKPFLIGLALKDQMLPSNHRIPTEPWDCPVDTVLFGDKVL